jgi:small subunit ribosomal protein S11
LAKQETQKTMVKKPTVAKSRKKVVRNVPSGIAHVKATFNNTIVSITDLTGNVISWASAGKAGYIGSRKSSAFAATVAAQEAAKVAVTLGMKEIEVNLSGPGAGRESAVRGLQSAGLAITIIRDKTPVPHNGCRPRKRRRV